MDYLVISILSILVISIFVAILLVNSRTSTNISLKGRTLSILHPLKKDTIQLEKDLKSWKVSKMNLLWQGKLYALNLETKAGEWKKIYFRRRSDKIKHLIDTLELVAPNGRT